MWSLYVTYSRIQLLIHRRLSFLSKHHTHTPLHHYGEAARLGSPCVCCAASGPGLGSTLPPLTLRGSAWLDSNRDHAMCTARSRLEDSTSSKSVAPPRRATLLCPGVARRGRAGVGVCTSTPQTLHACEWPFASCAAPVRSYPCAGKRHVCVDAHFEFS